VKEKDYVWLVAIIAIIAIVLLSVIFIERADTSYALENGEEVNIFDIEDEQINELCNTYCTELEVVK
jgi:hypothetical protein